MTIKVGDTVLIREDDGSFNPLRHAVCVEHKPRASSAAVLYAGSDRQMHTGVFNLCDLRKSTPAPSNTVKP